MRKRLLVLFAVASIAFGFVASVTGAATGLFSFDGKPSSLQPFHSHNDYADFDVQVHSRDQSSWGDHSLPDEHYDHGMNCAGSPDISAFPQHTSSSYAETVFICNDHIMTANAGSGYGAVVLTPNRLIDLADGKTVTVRFAMSTFRQSDRDWLEFGFTPWEDNITIPCRFCPDLQGEPDRYISLHMSQENGGTGFALYENGQMRGGICPCYESWLTPDKARRDIVEVEFSNTHMKVTMPEYGKVMKDVTFQNQGWGPVVFQMIHHSYNPDKGHAIHGGQAGPTTWHWDDVSVTPSTPFEIIKSDQRALLRKGPGEMGSMKFTKAAPKNAYLRFAAFANPDVSFDGGATWTRAEAQLPMKHVATESYFIPVPQGTQEVHFRANCVTWYCDEMHVKDVTIWAANGVGSSPLPSPTSTAAPSVTSTPPTGPGNPPTQVPAPTSTPAPQVPGEFGLRYSKSASRAGAVGLSNASVSGNVFVFLTPERTDIKLVQFWLDDTSMSREAFRVENNAPFDLSGGDIADAQAYNTRWLPNGNHTITTKVDFANGTSTVLNTVFVVAN